LGLSLAYYDVEVTVTVPVVETKLVLVKTVENEAVDVGAEYPMYEVQKSAPCDWRYEMSLGQTGMPDEVLFE
jgi:hypothetical protein